MNLLDWWRVAVNVATLCLLYRIGNYMRQLLAEGQHDKSARENTIGVLKDTAIALAERTALMLAESEARTASANRRVDAALAHPPNEETLKSIEVNTKDTADALKDKR